MAEQQGDDRLPAFGEEAHRVLARARAAAHRLRHATLGTEHVLLGCAEEPHGEAAELFFRAGITPTELLDHVRLLGNPVVDSPPPELRMAPGLRAALRLAREEAERLGDGEVRSEHLLLALLSERTGGGGVVLRATGLDVWALRAAVDRRHLGAPTHKPRGPWIAQGPYRALALLGIAAILGALAFTIRWLITVRPVVRSAYLLDLLIPVALLGMGMVGLGASRMEALRQTAARESLLAFWSARSAAAQAAGALELARAGQLERAIPQLEAAVDRAMPEAEVRATLRVLARWLAADELAPIGAYARGLLRVHAGQLQTGLADLETAVKRRPAEAHWQGVYGQWLACAGQDDAADPLLAAATERQPVEPAAALAYALLLLRRGDPHAAERAARLAAERMPGAARPLAALAAAQELLGTREEASASLHAALALDPYDTLAQAVRAVALLRRGSAEEALSSVHDAAAGTSERTGYLAAIEGWALSALGRDQEARLAFAQAQELEPSLTARLTRLRQGLIESNLDEAAREVEALLARIGS